MRTEKMRQGNIQKVYEASAELFANYGVSSTSLEDIAEKAGVSLRSVVNYFGKKEKLIKDMRLYYVERATAHMREIFSSDSFKALSGKEKLCQTIETIVEYGKEKYLYVYAMMEMRSLESNPNAEDDEIIPPIMELRELLKCYVHEGIKDGSIKNDSKFAEYVPLLIITVKGFLSQYSNVMKNNDLANLEAFNESFDSLYRFLNELLDNQI